MSKQFFTELGDQLHSMKGSPFMRVGENPILKNQSRKFGQIGGLSYDPDRLFNEEKRKEEEKLLDSEIIENHRKEKEQLEKIEFELLKKNTDEKYKKELKKMELMRRFDHKHPYSWFGVYRGACLACEACGEYEGCFSQGLRQSGIQIMQCCKCQCPMNSHLIIPEPNPFSDQIWKHLVKRDMMDSDIKINYKVLAFKVPKAYSHEYGGVVNLLSQIGYQVKDIFIDTKLHFEVGLIKTMILKDGAKDWYVESLLNILDSIEAEGQWNWESSRINISESFEEAYEIVKRIAFDLPFRINDDDEIFIALCTHQIQNSSNAYKFLKKAKQALGEFSFIWGSNGNKQSLICSQNFFETNFEIQYQIFLLPSVLDQKKAKYNSHRFRDVLDYNGYTLFMEDISNLERLKFQNVFNYFSGSKINYLLGEQILSEKIKRVGIKLTARIGPSRLVIPFDPSPDFVSVGKQTQIRKTMLSLYPQFSYSQRCVLVIRPFVLNASFEQAIINLLRINKFVLIKRIKIKLSVSEASYLATLEGISDDRVDSYVEFMTAGVCEIILVSKRSAIYEVYALSNGCLSGPSSIPTKIFRDAPTVELHKGRDNYEYEFGLSSYNNHIFSSIRETIGIEDVLFGSSPPPQFMTNTKTGEIMKISPDPPKETMQIPAKMKESMLKALRKDQFNYWMFLSKSETITEELTGIFLPECTLFEPITIIVKPGLTHLVPSLKKVLSEHKYHIICEKQVVLDKITAAQFIFNCQKIMLPKQTLKAIIQKYSTEPIHILCLSKISGRKEIMSMLSDFSFLSSPSISNYEEYGIEDSMLKDILVPVWNNEDIILRLISEPLGNIEESIKVLEDVPEAVGRALAKSEKYILLDYLVGSFFGVNIDDLDLNTKIGKLSYYIAEDLAPRQQSWYYSQLSQVFPNYVPLLFQYRQLGQTEFCIQSERGVPFMEMIIKMFEEEKQKMKKEEVAVKKKRQSLVLYLWAKKITEFCLDLSETTTQLKGFGQIWEKNGEYQGNLSQEAAINEEKSFLNQIAEQYEDSPQISQNVKKLLSSRHLKDRYVENSKKLLPSFTLQGIRESIRVVDKTNTSKLHLVDKFSFIDPENQKNNLKDMYTLNLYNITPEIKTKYYMTAELFYYFIREEYDNVELSHMFSELNQLLTDLFAQVPDRDLLEYELYLRYLIEFSHAPPDSDLKIWMFSLIKKYPSLKKSQKIDHDEVAGKKRKFLDHKQYFVRKNEGSDERANRIQRQYMNFDLNSLQEPRKPNALFDPKDPLHKRFAGSENRVNLLRDGEEMEQKRPGIYVEFEKNISEKEELLKQKIKNEVEKFNVNQKEEILHETGLEKDLWYRRKKGEARPDRESKVNSAIQKQISKFVSFKEDEQKKISRKEI